MKNLWISNWVSSVGIMEISCCYDRWKRSCGVLNIRLGLRHNWQQRDSSLEGASDHVLCYLLRAMGLSTALWILGITVKLQSYRLQFEVQAQFVSKWRNWQ